jgi:hypothetical protein
MLESVRAYYGRRFCEKLLLALGEDFIEKLSRGAAIDPYIDDVVNDAGFDAGLKIRKEILRGY